MAEIVDIDGKNVTNKPVQVSFYMSQGLFIVLRLTVK